MCVGASFFPSAVKGLFFKVSFLFTCRFVFIDRIRWETFSEDLFYYYSFFLKRKCFFDVPPLIFWRRPSSRHCLDAGACQENKNNNNTEGRRRPTLKMLDRRDSHLLGGWVSDTMLFVEPMVLCQPCLVFYYAENGTDHSFVLHKNMMMVHFNCCVRQRAGWLFVFINNRISSSEISDDVTLRGSSSSSSKKKEDFLSKLLPYFVLLPSFVQFFIFERIQIFGRFFFKRRSSSIPPANSCLSHFIRAPCWRLHAQRARKEFV